MGEDFSRTEYKKRNQFLFIWKRLKKSRTAMFGLVVLIFFFLLIIFADVIVDYEDVALYQDYTNRLALPSAEHWFGTDNYGRDMLARVIHGTRVSYSIGFGAIGVASVIGIFLGAVAAYTGGWVDTIITRIMDTLMSIPNLLLSLAIMASLGSGAFNLAMAMAISNIPQFARLIRSSVLTVVDQEYVMAAKACGTSDMRIIFKHILPNAIGPIIVKATMAVATVIISAAGLSFVGMGVQPPIPEWGTLLAENRDFMRTNMNLVAFPGLAIVLSALSLNLLGDGLRDALDPRLKN
ncbi:ABC transporter permease [Tissierellaceae bacterium BX21]|uniref:ABC transporter permease n=2 Tax=Paratissierella segnis TaxID=2763679 RepID=A0A926EVX6_9FIRM|nr:ABC transporter permease [Paratissierella segnis]